MSLSPGGNPPFVDAAGNTHTPSQVLLNWCSPNTPGPPSDDFLKQCLAQHHIVGLLNKYQPASRMGTFHLIENSANLALLVLSLLAAWWFVRKLSITT